MKKFYIFLSLLLFIFLVSCTGSENVTTTTSTTTTQENQETDYLKRLNEGKYVFGLHLHEEVYDEITYTYDSSLFSVKYGLDFTAEFSDATYDPIEGDLEFTINVKDKEFSDGIHIIGYRHPGTMAILDYDEISLLLWDYSFQYKMYIPNNLNRFEIVFGKYEIDDAYQTSVQVEIVASLIVENPYYSIVRNIEFAKFTRADDNIFTLEDGKQDLIFNYEIDDNYTLDEIVFVLYDYEYEVTPLDYITFSDDQLTRNESGNIYLENITFHDYTPEKGYFMRIFITDTEGGDKFKDFLYETLGLNSESPDYVVHHDLFATFKEITLTNGNLNISLLTYNNGNLVYNDTGEQIEFILVVEDPNGIIIHEVPLELGDNHLVVYNDKVITYGRIKIMDSRKGEIYDSFFITNDTLNAPLHTINPLNDGLLIVFNDEYSGNRCRVIIEGLNGSDYYFETEIEIYYSDDYVVCCIDDMVAFKNQDVVKITIVMIVYDYFNEVEQYATSYEYTYNP